MRLLALLAVLALPTAGAVPIAVLDTGIDPDHPEFGAVERHSFVDYTPTPLPGDPLAAVEDPDGHGTAVASRAAGADLGSAPGEDLFDLQVSGRYTRGTVDPADEAAAVDALDWLLRNHGGPNASGPRVAVLGFAEGEVSETGAATMAAQAQSLFDAGVAVVVPSGPSMSALHASPHVLTVGCVDGCGGSGQNDPRKPDVVAPGRDVEVAQPGTPAMPGPTTTATGSAYAAAHVAGIVSRMWESNPGLPVDAAFSILRDTATPVEGPPESVGWGAVDGEAAVTAVAGWSDPVEPGGDTPENGAPTAPLAALLAVAVAVLVRRR